MVTVRTPPPGDLAEPEAARFSRRGTTGLRRWRCLRHRLRHRRHHRAGKTMAPEKPWRRKTMAPGLPHQGCRLPQQRCRRQGTTGGPNRGRRPATARPPEQTDGTDRRNSPTKQSDASGRGPGFSGVPASEPRSGRNGGRHRGAPGWPQGGTARRTPADPTSPEPRRCGR